MMKVTALIPDEMIKEVKRVSGGKNITESLIIALNYYLNNQKIQQALEEIESSPLEFNEDFAPYGVRKINRNR